MSNAERFDRVSLETSYSDEKLRYRRQFVVGPRHPETERLGRCLKRPKTRSASAWGRG